MARAVLVAQKTIERKNQQLQAKDTQIKMLEPKARFADAVFIVAQKRLRDAEVGSRLALGDLFLLPQQG